VFPSIPGMAGIPIDAWPSVPVMSFAFAISLATGIAFGTVPAWMATRADPMDALRGTGRTTAHTGSFPRAVLVVFQAALSLVLLSTAGLLTSALQRLEHQSFGFEREHRLVAHIDPRLAGYRPEQLTPLYDRIRDAISRRSGVSGVALSTYAPFGNNAWGAQVVVDGHALPGPDDNVSAYWNRVTAGYLDVLGTPIVRGRGISEEDTARSRRVAVVNEAFVRKFLKNEDPIGRRFGQHGIGSEREYEIVGVARDARYFDVDLDQPVAAFFYLPEAQHDFSRAAPPTDMNPGSHVLRDVIVETAPGRGMSPDELRSVLAAVDSALPITVIRTLDEQVAGAFTQQRLIARLTSFFGVLSLVLASIGLYGVTAYRAGRQTSEIGVRVALGATPRAVVHFVLRGTVWLILLGLLIGLPLSFGVGRFLGAQLYGASPFNVGVSMTAVAALGLSALVAAMIPALRATTISPVDALRAE